MTQCRIKRKYDGSDFRRSILWLIFYPFAIHDQNQKDLGEASFLVPSAHQGTCICKSQLLCYSHMFVQGGS